MSIVDGKPANGSYAVVADTVRIEPCLKSGTAEPDSRGWGLLLHGSPLHLLVPIRSICARMPFWNFCTRWHGWGKAPWGRGAEASKALRPWLMPCRSGGYTGTGSFPRAATRRSQTRVLENIDDRAISGLVVETSEMQGAAIQPGASSKSKLAVEETLNLVYRSIAVVGNNRRIGT